MISFTFSQIMPARRFLIGALCLVAGLALAGAASAQGPGASEAPSPDAVIATVAGETITEGDLVFAAEDLAQELQGVPPQQRRAFLTAVLVDMKLMARAAREANMQDSEVFRRRLQYLEDRALRRAYFAERIGTQVTEEAVQAAYDAYVASFVPVEEVRARHILVTSQDDSEAIRAEIMAGKPFEQAAAENSIDGSAQNGGDLGYFPRGRMVAPFEQAAFSMAPGDVSQPVQSRFGWHLIKVEDRRESAPLPLGAVRPELQDQVMVDAFNAQVTALREGAEVSFTDPAMAAAVAAEQGVGN